jgi:hypothetical protein
MHRIANQSPGPLLPDAAALRFWMLRTAETRYLGRQSTVSQERVEVEGAFPSSGQVDLHHFPVGSGPTPFLRFLSAFSSRCPFSAHCRILQETNHSWPFVCQGQIPDAVSLPAILPSAASIRSRRAAQLKATTATTATTTTTSTNIKTTRTTIVSFVAQEGAGSPD